MTKPEAGIELRTTVIDTKVLPKELLKQLYNNRSKMTKPEAGIELRTPSHWHRVLCIHIAMVLTKQFYSMFRFLL